MENEKSNRNILRTLLLLFTIVAVGSAATLGAGTLMTIVAPDFLTSIYGKIYDGISLAAGIVFGYFQEIGVMLISIGFALWLVHETYLGMHKALAMGEGKIDQEYFRKIYRKLFLSVAIIGLFLINDVRPVMRNTFEIILNVGSGIGREILQRRMGEARVLNKQWVDERGITVDCGNIHVEYIYEDGEGGRRALSRNTKHEMQCMMREAAALRYSYIELGSHMFAHGVPMLITAAVANISTRVGTAIAGKKVAKLGKGAMKAAQKKLEKIEKSRQEALKKSIKNDVDTKILKGKKNLTQAEKDQLKKLDEEKKKLEKEMKELQKQSKSVRGEMAGAAYQMEKGTRIQDGGEQIANLTSAGFFMLSDDVKLGLAGIFLMGGFFLINMMFGFIIIEQLIFMGMAVIIFPLLISGFVFEQTRQFATKALVSTRKYAVGLVLMCFAIVLCAAFNDWIFAGMLGGAENATENARRGIELLKNNQMKEFSELIERQAGSWYILYILFAVIVNLKILEKASEFAGWFDGQIQKSELGEAMKTFGKSVVALPLSAGREVSNYLKDGTGSSKISRTKEFTKRLFGKGEDI